MEIKTEFIYKQLGQITIALPIQISPALDEKPNVVVQPPKESKESEV